jgi:hypothetical protein
MNSKTWTRIITTVAIAVGALLMSPLAFVPTAAAEVVYTRVNVTLSGTGSIKLDLNHDGITDFVLHSASQLTTCGDRGGLIGSTIITPTTDDGVVVSHLDFAAVLGSGIPIGASATFYKARTVVTQFFICSSGSQHVAGYLGLEFQINGQTHYGWAQVSIDAHYQFQGTGMRTTLVGFAYETVPSHAIKTGQTSGYIDEARSVIPESIHPFDFGYGSPAAAVLDSPLTESLVLNVAIPTDGRWRPPQSRRTNWYRIPACYSRASSLGKVTRES